jgi:hypothetical protein
MKTVHKSMVILPDGRKVLEVETVVPSPGDGDPFVSYRYYNKIVHFIPVKTDDFCRDYWGRIEGVRQCVK